MATNEVIEGYTARADGLAAMLGATVAADDPDRALIEPWAAGVGGPILDVGSGTGRWTGHLAALGHEVVGLEPVGQFLAIAQEAHPGVEFRRAEIADLVGSQERWAGILAWYSLIHLGPGELTDALLALRGVLDVGGTLLVSFFTGSRLETLSHPAATAYIWPVERMAEALTSAGFDVVDRHDTPGAMHAAIVAIQQDHPI